MIEFRLNRIQYRTVDPESFKGRIKQRSRSRFKKNALSFLIEPRSHSHSLLTTRMSSHQLQVDLEKNISQNDGQQLTSSSHPLQDGSPSQEEEEDATVMSQNEAQTVTEATNPSKWLKFKKELRRRILHTTPSWFSVK